MVEYSICMCNYNMAATLDVALRSILDQIDERFEIVIIDDGSTDESVQIIKKMQQEYPALRLIELQRDPRRQLGFTRNVSVQEAKGKYVLLHLDCDDITAPHIQDYVEVFHQIEKCFPYDILLSGSPIHMGKRDFLLQHGPYRNIHRGEDRDMLGRLSMINAYIPLTAKTFKTRLPKTRSDRYYRTIYYTFDALRNFFRAGETLSMFISNELKYQRSIPMRSRILRLILAVPAWLRAKSQGALPGVQNSGGHERMVAYKQKMGGTFTKIMKDHGRTPDWDVLKPAARAFFDL